MMHVLGSCQMVPGIDYQKFDFRDISMPGQAHFDAVCRWCLRGSLRPKDNSNGTEMSSSTAEAQLVFLRRERRCGGAPPKPTCTARDQVSAGDCLHSIYAVPYCFFFFLHFVLCSRLPHPLCRSSGVPHQNRWPLRRCWSPSLPSAWNRKVTGNFFTALG